MPLAMFAETAPEFSSLTSDQCRGVSVCFPFEFYFCLFDVDGHGGQWRMTGVVRSAGFPYRLSVNDRNGVTVIRLYI